MAARRIRGRRVPGVVPKKQQQREERIVGSKKVDVQAPLPAVVLVSLRLVRSCCTCSGGLVVALEGFSAVQFKLTLSTVQYSVQVKCRETHVGASGAWVAKFSSGVSGSARVVAGSADVAWFHMDIAEQAPCDAFAQVGSHVSMAGRPDD